MLVTHSDLPEDPSLIHSIYVGWLPKVSNSSSRGSSFHLSLSLKTTFLRYNLHITMFTLLNAQFNDFFFKENSSSTPKTPLLILYLELKSKGLIECLKVNSCLSSFQQSPVCLSPAGNNSPFPLKTWMLGLSGKPRQGL